jgi:hypothetical protein
MQTQSAHKSVSLESDRKEVVKSSMKSKGQLKQGGRLNPAKVPV